MIASGATLWLVNATQSFSTLPIVCQRAREAGQSIHVLHWPGDREAILRAAASGGEFIRFIELEEGSSELPGIEDGTEVLFLPCSDRIDWADLQRRPQRLEHSHCLQPLFAGPPRFSTRFYVRGPLGWWGWRASGDLARRILREPSAWEENGVDLVETLQHWPDPPRWQSTPIHLPGFDDYPAVSPPTLTMSSSVLAVISFYRCEEWLHACLTCLAQQTRPPDGIVVIDDCSPALPIDLVRPFPNVTLLSTTQNIGPERILNNIIRATDYDAYMVQDPDDWSTHDRLECSLRTAEQSGAAMLGSQEFRVDTLDRILSLCVYPPDVNYANSFNIAHYVLHGTSLISRWLVMRLGGFDERLKLCGDIDFHARSVYGGRVVNLSRFCTFRRVRGGSLTTHETTGYKSMARIVEDKFVSLRARRNIELHKVGKEPNYSVPYAPRVGFIHHHGPQLRLSEQGLTV